MENKLHISLLFFQIVTLINNKNTNIKSINNILKESKPNYQSPPWILNRKDIQI